MIYINQINSYIPNSEAEIRNKEVMLDFINLIGEDVLYRRSKLAHLTSSGFILNHTMTKVLMAHHNIYNTWAWTGGHADGDKDLLLVALKEAKEETGVINISPLSQDVLSIDILPVYSHMKNGAFVNTHLHLNVSYVLLTSEEEKLTISSDENSDVRWICINKIDEYCNEPDMVIIYKKLIEKAKSIANQKNVN
ncbi:MAG: NUDIX hydrolase [Clostridiales bacterium]|nr:NUDIX hydrolase [Clostridiales bacterium]